MLAYAADWMNILTRWFHLIVGMLHLFGFRLPETHRLFYLSSSFTDFWRRINIYWKDFMQKIFYYPAVFRLKHLGTTRALVIATLYVFVMTWFLHAYQWFWLRGTMRSTKPPMVSIPNDSGMTSSNSNSPLGLLPANWTPKNRSSAARRMSANSPRRFCFRRRATVISLMVTRAPISTHRRR